MEISRVPRHLPSINLRFHQSSTFRSSAARCSLLEAKEFPGLSTADQMFILGMGFVGKFFAADLKNKGWNEVLEVVKNHTHLAVSIPPLKGLGDPVLYFFGCLYKAPFCGWLSPLSLAVEVSHWCYNLLILCHKGLLESVLKDGRLRWLVYLSPTSVYGDSGGAWVDEDYPVKPESELATARLATEEEWLRFGQNLGIAAHVFRLGGIYGPGRSAADTILKQQPMSKRQKGRLLKDYTSRVHVADICQALHASLLNPSAGKIYNIVDDDPAPREEVFEFARKLVEEKHPGPGKQYIYTERAESLVMEKPLKAEKQVSNARMKKELGVELLFPTYRSGLRGIMEHTAQLS